MATTTNSNGTLIDTIMDAQTNFVNEMAENAKKLTEKIPVVNTMIEKGQEAFKEAATTGKKVMSELTENIQNTTENATKSSENNQNFFMTWLENQMNASKNMFQNNYTFPGTENMWNNNPWMNMMNGYNQNFQNWMNQQPNMFFQKPFQMNGTDMMNNWNSFMKQYMENATKYMNLTGVKFDQSTIADSMKGLNNMTESTMKFFELWLPMLKDLQNNTFNKDVFTKMFDTAKYKEFMDKFFGFMPDNVQQMVNQMNTQFAEYWKQFGAQGNQYYTEFKKQMENNPFMNMQNPFAAMWENYSKMNQSMKDAMAPFAKLMADQPAFKASEVWSNLAERVAEFNIKNNQLQYMMYQQGMKVMEQMVEKMSAKIQNGENIDSLLKVYQDWMTTGDAVYTDFFKSDEYSKLMTEVSSLQLKLKLDIEKQIETTILKDMPVATRSEMDEVYKNIYDLKKMYRRLEKMMTAEAETTEADATEQATAAKATTKKK